MRIIRTGNDIKVMFTIEGPASKDTVNMKLLRVYFVKNPQQHTCFVKRFPKEPFPLFYTPSEYTTHCCGKFEYNVNPSYNKCEYATCGGGCHDYHIWPNYNGFGINSKKFDDCCSKPKPNEFMAPFCLEEYTNDVSAYFPACQQHDGVYRVIVVMTAYESGWGKHNLHTYTIDYGEVFELTHDESGEQGEIIIDLRKVQPGAESYIGFSPIESADDVDVTTLEYTSDLKKEYSISNLTGGWAYLWIISKNPITKLTISGYEQPIKLFSRTDYIYCYRSYLKLDTTQYKFIIS